MTGRPPSAYDISRLVGELRASATPLSATAADVVAILYLTGARVGAVLDLTATDVRLMPDGRVWAFVHQKARTDDRPLRLRTDLPEVLDRIKGLSGKQSLWADGARQLTYQVFRQRLSLASARADLARVRPHDLRRAFASDVAARLGLHTTARAGGWLAETVTEGYISTRRRT